MRAIRITQSNWLNDQVGGDRNTVKLVQDDMAREAVEVHKIAEYAPEYDRPQPQEAPAVQQQETLHFTGQVERDAVQELVNQTEELGLYDEPETADTEEMTMPWTNASKADWIKWAVRQGANPSAAASLTKLELMGRYGERL